MNNIVDKFVDKLNNYSIKLSNLQINQFLKYYEMLIEKNKVMNLTAITDFEEVVDKHFIDSLSILRIVNVNNFVDNSLSVIDLGTGAGFPGIPLKIVFPDNYFLLADSLNKRISFLNEVIHELGLEFIDTVHGRAEDLAKNKCYREKFDICVSRAVANLSTLSEYCIPFVKVGGRFISYKSGSIDEELAHANNAIQVLGGKVSDVDKFKIEDNDRSLVMIEKIDHSPSKYPRKAGTPSNNPL